MRPDSTHWPSVLPPMYSEPWWSCSPVPGGCVGAVDWAEDAGHDLAAVANDAAGYAGSRPFVREVHVDPDARWALKVAGSWSVLEYLRTTLGPAIAIESTALYHRPAGAVGVVPLHQDGGTPSWQLDPQWSASALFVLDGPAGTNMVDVLPRSHTVGYAPHTRALDDGVFARHPTAILHKPQPRPVSSTPGQAVLLDVRTVRGYAHAVSPGATWSALLVRYVAPHGWYRRPYGSPRLVVLRGDAEPFGRAARR